MSNRLHMTNEEFVVDEIRKSIAQLPPEDRFQCYELAEHIRGLRKGANLPVGTLAICLVGAEIQLENS